MLVRAPSISGFTARTLPLCRRMTCQLSLSPISTLSIASPGANSIEVMIFIATSRRYTVSLT